MALGAVLQNNVNNSGVWKMKNMFAIVPQFLKNPQEFFGSVQRNEELKPKALSLFISTVVFLLIYGFITGLSHSFSQGLSTAVKMPILFLLTLAFTLPALYFFVIGSISSYSIFCAYIIELPIFPIACGFICCHQRLYGFALRS